MLFGYGVIWKWHISTNDAITEKSFDSTMTPFKSIGDDTRFSRLSANYTAQLRK